ncbi:ankyrin repeat domain-containing protein [Methyloversatilis thermotolerans]|uniref:ankyrin repeat domain-containing protein n=1 Tax=Methyloversatilis thermotolerans TaxID=1346290 RepID=UPI0004758B3B|nr:ankyrin repeat domain-containing protein [Methyloversatilis thermotolerans]
MRMVSAVLLSLSMAAASGASAAAYDDLINAANMGDVPAVSAFIDRGLDVNSVDLRGETLLIIAARNGYGDMVKALLARRARIEAVNAVGETALAVAAFSGHADIVEQLLAAGANPVNPHGWSALHYAAMQGHSAALRALIARGAPVDALAPNGATALMLAARASTETVKVLLGARADVRIRGREGETALDWAIKAGNTDAAALIRAAQAQ